jgi:hypothetical protein
MTNHGLSTFFQSDSTDFAETSAKCEKTKRAQIATLIVVRTRFFRLGSSITETDAAIILEELAKASRASRPGRMASGTTAPADDGRSGLSGPAQRANAYVDGDLLAASARTPTSSSSMQPNTQLPTAAPQLLYLESNPKETLRARARKPGVVTGPHPGGGWQNKLEGNQQASNVAPTKAETQTKGRQMAVERKTEHKGRITERNSYGKDPYGRRMRETRGANTAQGPIGEMLAERSAGRIVERWAEVVDNR